jgi:eukaryotic-like serine/threonine-protein kinase
MVSESIPSILGQRYRLLNLLGAGGMGRVYRAIDRLTGQVLALKRVLVPADQLEFGTRTAPQVDFQIALAQEFQLLAALRHPSIIGVLDYGFDSERHAFLTMELVENAQTIRDAAQDQPLIIQIELLIQLLQALAYLHRRDVVHRDLKPSNVLVKSGQVKVLDFGISIVKGHSGAISGTLAYMAPEVLRGEPAGLAADLYAVGILAYELMMGHPPYDAETPSKLVEDILNTPLDLVLTGVDSQMANVLERLLAKRPRERYANANEVIEALSTIIHQPVLIETGTSRESLLQTTKMVGREAELAQLSEGLTQSVVGLGSSWLIGGESGIGKSRLVDELRTLGLVNGALVLRGHAISGGSRPYEVWRDPLRRLVLASDLDDVEASVLKAVVPDISALLEREVPDAPEFDSQATQGRLLSTVANVLKRHEQPIMMLLENLHWADDESLALLAWLNQIVPWLPVQIVGNFRDDERPELPSRLPETRVIRLRRLSEQSIAELSESMLGTVGRQSQIVDLLQRETEGNPFFVIEVVRALAEEAGRLDKIGVMRLPEHVFTGGVRRIIERRLSRVPAEGRPLLQLAAISGNQLDLSVLRALAPTTDVDQWLINCANVAVLELEEGQWRFAHDKLRQGLLTDLEPERVQDLHRQVAEAIERVYPVPISQAAALAHHWGEAGDTAKESHYTALAGAQALRTGAYQTAIPYLRRALTLASQANGTRAGHAQTAESRLQQAYLGRQLAEAYYGAGDLTKSREHQEWALKLLGYPVPVEHRKLVTGTLRQALIQGVHKILPARFVTSSQARRPAVVEAVYGYQQLVQIYYFSGEALPLIHATIRGLNLAETTGTLPRAVWAQIHANMATASGFIPMHRLAETYGRQAREYIKGVDDLATVSWVLQLMGTYDAGVGQWSRAVESLSQAVEIAERIAHKRRWQESSSILAVALFYRGEFSRAAQIRADVTAAVRRNSTPATHAWALLFQIESALPLGQVNEAMTMLDEVAGILGDNMNPTARVRVQAMNALTSLYMGEHDLARQAADTALDAVMQFRPTSINLLLSYDAIADVYLTLWEAANQEDRADREDLARRATQACDILASTAKIFPIAQPSLLQMGGRADWLAGRQDSARKAWQQSLTLAEKLAMPYEQASAHYEIGRHLDAQDPARKEHLARAAEIYGQLGAAYHLARAQME